MRTEDPLCWVRGVDTLRFVRLALYGPEMPSVIPGPR